LEAGLSRRRHEKSIAKATASVAWRKLEGNSGRRHGDNAIKKARAGNDMITILHALSRRHDGRQPPLPTC
jgi:hypothetical protein